MNPETQKPERMDETAILVLESSATEAVPGQARHNHIPIDGDHRSITKFPKITNSYFQQVALNIGALVEVAKAICDKQSLRTCRFSGFAYKLNDTG